MILRSPGPHRTPGSKPCDNSHRGDIIHVVIVVVIPSTGVVCKSMGQTIQGRVIRMIGVVRASAKSFSYGKTSIENHSCNQGHFTKTEVKYLIKSFM